MPKGKYYHKRMRPMPKFVLLCEIEGVVYTFVMPGPKHAAPRFRWMTRDGRCTWVELRRNGRLYRRWDRGTPPDTVTGLDDAA